MFLRRFWGHNAYLTCSVAVYEATANATRITTHLVHRVCFGCGCTGTTDKSGKEPNNLPTASWVGI